MIATEAGSWLTYDGPSEVSLGLLFDSYGTRYNISPRLQIYHVGSEWQALSSNSLDRHFATAREGSPRMMLVEGESTRVKHGETELCS